MSQIEIDRVLGQIRALRAQASGSLGPLPQPAQPLGGAEDRSSVSFSAVLKHGLDQVNAAQQRARTAATAFEQGKPDIDLAQTMLEMQKASIAFRAAVEVRNKLVSAYQEIMNMPV
jgi:flagellar hook-basal body complex protein FliE